MLDSVGAGLRIVAAVDRLVGAGKIQAKNGAAPELALAADLAAVLFDEAVHDRQAEAGALDLVAGREEGLEHAADDVGGIPSPVSRISSTTWRPGAIPCGPGSSAPRSRFAVAIVTVPSSGDRLAGVDHQVEQDLLEARRVRHHVTKVGRESSTTR